MKLDRLSQIGIATQSIKGFLGCGCISASRRCDILVVSRGVERSQSFTCRIDARGLGDGESTCRSFGCSCRRTCSGLSGRMGSAHSRRADGIRAGRREGERGLAGIARNTRSDWGGDFELRCEGARNACANGCHVGTSFFNRRNAWHCGATLGFTKPLPFRGGVGVGVVNLVQHIGTGPTPDPSPEGEGRL